MIFAFDKTDRTPFIFVVLILLIASLAPVTSARAQKAALDPARLMAARKLMIVTGAARNFEAVIPLMTRNIKTIIARAYPGKDAIINDIFKRMNEKFGNRKQELIDQIAELYAREMTTADMNKLNAFYNTDVGKRFIALQPKLIRASGQLGQVWGRKIGQEIVAEVRAELKKRGVAR